MDCTGADISGRMFFAFFRPRVPKNEVLPVVDSKVNNKIFQMRYHSNNSLFGVFSVVGGGGNVCVNELDGGGLSPFIIVDIAAGDEAGGPDTGGADLTGGCPFFLSIEKKPE